jgi:hypothetical protein
MAASETRIGLINVVARKRKFINPLTLNLLTTTIVAPPSNASKWQIVFNSAFKGLKRMNLKPISVQCCPKESCFWESSWAVLVRETRSWKWVWTDSGIILTRENRSSRRKTVPLSAFPPQISHGLTWDRTQASAVRGQPLKTKKYLKYIIFT